ncbi:spore germination protein [Pontibacillus yanchengensis]|uniref:Spore germination protein n=1 Tax=Pontibacillus yanchengensis TaxID=462910 RepID=A0A6I5A1S4_9BACI|nr:spore germination protein [Pontibacillus yanchengensis]MYL34927.1 spore germination protein [Pontibacillus yanchengensis]
MKFRRKQKRKSESSHQSSNQQIATLTVEAMRELFDGCADVKFYDIATQAGVFTAIMCDELYNEEQLFDQILKPLQTIQNNHNELEKELNYIFRENSLSLHKKVYTEQILTAVFTGHVIVLHEERSSIWEVQVVCHPKRQVEEPKTEISIRGSREGFVEEVSVNMALVRKRIPSKTLKMIKYEIGERTKTKVMLLYLEDVTNSETVEEAKSRLEKLKVDGLVSNLQLEELIVDTKKPLFPLFVYTGRPDFVVDSLLHGRFAILMDGAPTALIAPVNLLFVLKTAEDNEVSSIFVAFERLLRYMALYFALFLPAFWIALLSYHPDQLPFTLLATAALSREGVPLPAPLECFFMLLLFEIFREAGVRLPMSVGQILSVVGGIIIGQAAIAAGFTAPGILVVNAVALVSTFTLINQSLTSLVGILRLIILLITSFLGMFGFFLCIFAVIGYLANLRSFGVPYLAPLSPTRPKEIPQALWNPRDVVQNRPKMLRTPDKTRQGRKKK